MAAYEDMADPLYEVGRDLYGRTLNYQDDYWVPGHHLGRRENLCMHS